MSAVIVDQAVYRDGKRRPCEDLSDELARIRADEDSSSFIWIGLKNPSDREFAVVNDELELHPLAVEDAIEAVQEADEILIELQDSMAPVEVGDAERELDS